VRGGPRYGVAGRCDRPATFANIRRETGGARSLHGSHRVWGNRQVRKCLLATLLQEFAQLPNCSALVQAPTAPAGCPLLRLGEMPPGDAQRFREVRQVNPILLPM
jgi:hypothetical protein